ncbi:hypothetical protein ACLQ2R_12690 [Streptosporangium sp. DT93]|uniref:hypothetical protein n=1 Tax=Streptosporangium sp. DT93 TaxID=3393428 RepID=UPI003CEB5178
MVEHNYTLDFVAGDRRDRAILRHIVLSLFAGMLLGGIGAVLATESVLAAVLYEPHAYVLLVVVLGRTAAGLGWAVLCSVLATFGTVLSMLVAGSFTSMDWPTSLGSGGAAINFTIVKLVAIGVLSYLAGRHDRWGDLSAGGAAGVALLGGIDRALPASAGHVPGFWPWGALVAVLLAAGMIVSLGRGCDRLCSAAVALTLGASYFVFLAGL